MKPFIAMLLAMWEQLQSRLVQIGQGPEALKYSAVKRALRIEAIDAWRENALARVKEFAKTELPRVREERARNATAALLLLREGLSPADGPRAAVPKLAGPRPALPDAGIARDDPRWDEVTAWRGRVVQEATLAALQAIAGQLTLANAYVFSNLQSTETLARRLEAYLESAKEGAEFDFRGWAIDSIVSQGILQKRAADGGDALAAARATFALELFPKIESALIERFYPGDGGQGEYLIDKTVEVLNGMVEGRGDGAAENLRAAETWFGQLARSVQRGVDFPVETLPPPKQPPFRADVNDLIVRATLSSFVPAEIARLWGDRK